MGYRLPLSERQHGLLRNALVVAKERYEKDAVEFRELEPQLKAAEAAGERALFIHSRACGPLAEQFDRQAADVAQLIEQIDELEEA